MWKKELQLYEEKEKGRRNENGQYREKGKKRQSWGVESEEKEGTKEKSGMLKNIVEKAENNRCSRLVRLQCSSCDLIPQCKELAH